MSAVVNNNPDLSCGYVCAKAVQVSSKTVGSANGMCKLARFITKVMLLVATIFENFSVKASEFYMALKACDRVIINFDFINRIKDCIELAKEKTITAWKVMGTFFSTVGHACGVMYFLDEIKAISLSSIFGTIGKIPIFALISEPFSVLGYGFSTIDDGYKIKSTCDKVKIVSARVERLRVKAEIAAAVQDGTLTQKRAALGDRYRQACLAGKIDAETTQEKVDSLQEFIKNARVQNDTVQQDLSQKVTRWEGEKSDLEISRNKRIMSVAYYALRTLASILTLVGYIAGVGALAYNALPMIAMATLIATIGLTKFIYGEAVKPLEA